MTSREGGALVAADHEYHRRVHCQNLQSLLHVATKISILEWLQRILPDWIRCALVSVTHPCRTFTPAMPRPGETSNEAHAHWILLLQLPARRSGIALDPSRMATECGLLSSLLILLAGPQRYHNPRAVPPSHPSGIHTRQHFSEDRALTLV